MNEQDIAKINVWCEEFLTDLKSFKPKKLRNTQSVTIWTQEMEAFTLLPVQQSVDNYVRDFQAPIAEKAVARTIIRYSQLSSWKDNKPLFYYDVGLIVNDMLCSLVSHMGDINNRDVTAKRPGSSPILLGFENIAGFELRITVL